MEKNDTRKEKIEKGLLGHQVTVQFYMDGMDKEEAETVVRNLINTAQDNYHEPVNAHISNSQEYATGCLGG